MNAVNDPLDTIANLVPALDIGENRDWLDQRDDIIIQINKKINEYRHPTTKKMMLGTIQPLLDTANNPQSFLPQIVRMARHDLRKMAGYVNLELMDKRNG